jgi:hypothetical protein
MNREAILIIEARCERFIDNDGQSKPAAFLEAFNDRGQWLGEDLSFFSRLPAAVEVEALITGESGHDGQALPLNQLAGL